MSASYDEPDPLRFATLCLVVGFIAGLSLGVAALAAQAPGTTVPRGQ